MQKTRFQKYTGCGNDVFPSSEESNHVRNWMLKWPANITLRERNMQSFSEVVSACTENAQKQTAQNGDIIQTQWETKPRTLESEKALVLMPRNDD